MAGTIPAVTHIWKSTWTVAWYEPQPREVGIEKQAELGDGGFNPPGEGVGKSAIPAPLLLPKIRRERG